MHDTMSLIDGHQWLSELSWLQQSFTSAEEDVVDGRLCLLIGLSKSGVVFDGPGKFLLFPLFVGGEGSIIDKLDHLSALYDP